MWPASRSRIVRVAALAQLLIGCSAEAPGYFEIPKPKFDVPVPYAVTGPRLGIWDGQEYAPIFIKGVSGPEHARAMYAKYVGA